MSTGLKESVFTLTLSPGGCVILTFPSVGLGHLVCEAEGFYQVIPEGPSYGSSFHFSSSSSSSTELRH